MFDHLPEGFGESQQLVEEVVTSSEADDVDHPHPLKKKKTPSHREANRPSTPPDVCFVLMVLWF